MSATLEKPLTAKDYEALTDGVPYQLIDGELIMTLAPSPFHQFIIGHLHAALHNFVESKNGGRVFVSPVDVWLTEHDVYQPDIIFFRKEKLKYVERARLNVIPDLVVEVLSPSNAFYDLTHKKTVYAESGVEEYWVIDTNDETVEIFVLDGTRYRSVSFFKNGETLSSRMLPDFSMPLSKIFEF